MLIYLWETDGIIPLINFDALPASTMFTLHSVPSSVTPPEDKVLATQNDPILYIF